MTERIHLPDTKPCINHSFKIDGVKGYISVTTHENKPVELFLTISKEGSTLAGFADAFAQVVSIALQYGVPVNVLQDKFIDARFAPMGTTTNSKIPTTTSIIDYVFRWIDLTFPSR